MNNILLKQQIDTEITNKILVNSISPTNVGNSIKAVVDYVDQEIEAINGVPGPQGEQGPIGLTGPQGPPGAGGVVNTYEDVFSSTNGAPFPTSSKTIWRLNSAGFTYALPLDVELGAVIYIYSNVNCTLYNSPNPGNQGGILRTIFNASGNGDAFKNLQSGKIYRCTYLGNFGSSYGYWNIEIINNL